MQTTRYFYPGSFDLKLLQSTRQGDFASLQRGLNPLYSTEYKSALTTAKAFLSLNHRPVSQGNSFLQINEQLCVFDVFLQKLYITTVIIHKMKLI